MRHQKRLKYFSLSLSILELSLTHMEEGHEQGLIEKLVSKTEKLGWNKLKVSLEVDQSADVQSKFMLIGKILSLKPFSRSIV